MSQLQKFRFWNKSGNNWRTLNCVRAQYQWTTNGLAKALLNHCMDEARASKKGCMHSEKNWLIWVIARSRCKCTTKSASSNRAWARVISSDSEKEQADIWIPYQNLVRNEYSSHFWLNYSKKHFFFSLKHLSVSVRSSIELSQCFSEIILG